MTRFALLALGAALVATPAIAQDFTGPRVEASVGYDKVDANAGIPGVDDDLDGVRLGAAVGYDVEVGRTFVIGAEAGIGWSLSDASDQAIGANRFRTESGRDIDLSLRLGAKVTPRTLLYVKAGYANSQFAAEFRTPGGTTPAVTRVEDDESGYRLGAGVEHMLGEHTYLKAEYRYTDYGDDVSRHQALVGFGYRF